MKIYLATDHAGFEMKENIRLFLELEKENILQESKKSGQLISDLEIIDFGAYHYEEGDDYPKYISVAAGQLSSDIYTGQKTNLAIVFGGSGEGEAMVADKYKGVRCGVINSENLELVKLLRQHNDANVLSIGARFVSEDFVKKAVQLFILTQFESSPPLGVGGTEINEVRHQRRVQEIEDIENQL